jgi:hypothetical protein
MTHPIRQDPDHGDIVKFLSSPETHGVDAVSEIETHISHIFLAGDTVYKLKKPVTLSFLDFSTRRLRRLGCWREFIINRRFAPEIYLGIARVTREGEGLNLDGGGETVEWLVKMRRFSQDDLASALARKGTVTALDIKLFADRCANAHETPIKSRLKSAQPPLETARMVIGNLTNHAADLIEPRRLKIFGAHLLTALDQLAPLLGTRSDAGLVRHCHGDLHLSNICRFDGALMPFDAMEFSDSMATIDVAYDIAFTVMDCVAVGRPDLANAFLNRYLSDRRDFGLLPTLPIFCALRAAVRTMVHSMDAQDPPRRARLVTAYFDLAEEFVRAQTRPALICIGGFSGTGKSTVAETIASKTTSLIGAPAINSDVYRKILFGAAPEDKLPAIGYSKTASARVHDRLFMDASRCLQAGWPVIVDATFLDASAREKAETIAKAQNAPFIGIWLDAKPDTLRQRVASRKSSASDADLAVLERQLATAEPPTKWIHVSANGALSETVSVTRTVIEGMTISGDIAFGEMAQTLD